MDNFMRVTAKATVAVVIPLYGYWNDVPDNMVNGEVLAPVLNRVYSALHNCILIFVAHPPTIEHKENDPECVANILISRAQAGNVLNVPVERDATYAQYVTEGINAALDTTNAQFVLILNPWVLLQHGAIDTMVDRVNFGDNAKVVSGYDVRALTEPEQFDHYKNGQPKEEWDLSFNFLGMPRYVAEMLELDSAFRTHKFLERDMWQRMSSKGFSVITSQRIPVFPFSFPWQSYETKAQFDADHTHFKQKWGFALDFKYEDKE